MQWRVQSAIERFRDSAQEQERRAGTRDARVGMKLGLGERFLLTGSLPDFGVYEKKETDHGIPRKLFLLTGDEERSTLDLQVQMAGGRHRRRCSHR